MAAQGYFGYLIKNVNASKKIKEWLVNTLPFGYLENVILEKNHLLCIWLTSCKNLMNY